MTTANLRALTPGRGTPAALLNAQGKILGAFFLWQLDENEYLIECEGGAEGHASRTLGDALEQFHFAEKFERVEHGGEVLWIFQHPSHRPFHCERAGERIVLHRSSQEYGEPWTAIWAPASEHSAIRNELRLSTVADVLEAELERKRILALYPRVDHEITAEANPLEVGLKNSVADNKGCYPGQEVLEKIISLGAPAKRLCLLRGVGPAPSIPTAWDSGRLTSAVNDDGEFVALAILRKTQALEGQALTLPGGVTAQVARVAPYQNSP